MLKIQRKPNLLISILVFLLVWADRLSMNKAILSSPLASRNLCRYCLNFGMFTDSWKTIKCS